MTLVFRKLCAEFFGTAILVAIVVGSGIMGTNLTQDTAVALLINAISTGLGLGLLIWLWGPISGAHFNPAVTLIERIHNRIGTSIAALYIVAQIAGAIAGALLANAMFDLQIIQTSTHDRVSAGTFIGEIVATAGLIVVINIFINRSLPALIPIAVPVWIMSAYFFTSSTSFANPAVTIGRIFSNTFAGIAPGSVLAFIAAQIIGAILGLVIAQQNTYSQFKVES